MRVAAATSVSTPSATVSQAEGAGQADDRPDDRQVVGVVPEVADEAPVDFEHVDGQRLELGERAVPGAEVVDGDLDADVA